ncbi:uncharacterized protein IL334_006168 [Kwoniella shivajii]|uniref:Uncharacterized protein n=1 Tax=Kwoniella shivajii TaxID=564305 RepID=A0ABZ1D779_9TREE|nr:hypothetical protein IL334_006168 [Kwoniella shivajii]
MPNPTDSSSSSSSVSSTSDTSSSLPDISSLSVSGSPNSESHSTQITSGWRISPHKIILGSCPCTRTHHQFRTSSQYLKYNLDRVDKSWSKLVHRSITPAILDSAERVFRNLRERGYELFHIAAQELPSSQGGSRRREVSILIMTPYSNNKQVGHRCLAEILVHLRISKGNNHINWKEGEEVENVACRFDVDWEDWTLSNPFTYLKRTEEMKQKHKRIMMIPDKRQGKSWDEILDSLLNEISKLNEEEGGIVFDNITKIKDDITRTTSEVRSDNIRPCGFEYELVYRETSRKTMSQAIKLGINIMDKSNRSKRYGIGALMFLELIDKKVKHTVTVYDGDWPIVHSYRTHISPPGLDGLAELIEK